MRKEKIITIRDRERDLTFRVREMPATTAESWITRALLLLGRGSGDKLIDSLQGVGADGADRVGAILSLICSGVTYEEAKPLLNELLECCTRVDAGIEQKCTAETVDGYIEDVRTLFRLRYEAATLTFGFFGEGSPLNSQDSEKQSLVNNKKQGRKPIQMSKE